MAQQTERPRVTEIQVRMDCNGCVQKVKKALHGIHGVSELYIDFPQQKITIVGSADPERIVKALKKTRKSAIVCSHVEQADPPTQPEEPAAGESEEAPPPSESGNNPPTEAPPAEAAKPTDPPKEPPKDPPTQENQQENQEKETPEGADNIRNRPDRPSNPRDVEEVHVIYHYPPDHYGYRNNFGQGSMSSHEPPPRDHGYRYNNFGQGSMSSHEPPPPTEHGYRYNNPGQNMIHEPLKGDHGYSRYNYGQSMSQEPLRRDHGSNRYNYGQSMSQEPLRRDHGSNRYNNYGQSMSPEPLRGDHGYRYNYAQTMIHEPPPDYRTNRARPIGPEFRQEAPPPGQPPVYVSHSYNNHQPSPYVTGYEYVRSPPRYTQYSTPRAEYYSHEDFQYGNNGGNGTISSVFSDENPNACTIA